MDELISNVLLWTPAHGLTSVDITAKTYIHRLCTNTGCRLDDLLRAIASGDVWQNSHGNSCYQHAMIMMSVGCILTEVPMYMHHKKLPVISNF